MISHIAIVEAHDCKSTPAQMRISRRILLQRRRLTMLTAIDFD